MFITPRIENHKTTVIGIAVLALLVSIFWGMSRYPALDTKAAMGANTELASLGFDVLIEPNNDAGFVEELATVAINWGYTNRQGMTFGILLAGLLMTLMSTGTRYIGRSRQSATLAGALIGTPLGVCANCATPIARGLQLSGMRAEASLASLVSSPTLNIIVLTMVFSLLPLYMAALKVLLTLVVIFVVIPVLAHWLWPEENAAACEADSSYPLADGTGSSTLGHGTHLSTIGWLGAGKQFLLSYLKNLWKIIRITLPLMIAAGFLGALAVTVVPLGDLVNLLPAAQGLNGLMAVIAISLFAIFLPVPMAFDVLIVIVLLEAGLDPGYAMVLLFGLGIFSVYPFLVLRESMPRKLVYSLTAALVAFSVIAGIAAHYLGAHHAREQERTIQTHFASQARSDDWNIIPKEYARTITKQSNPTYDTTTVLLETLHTQSDSTVSVQRYRQSPRVVTDGKRFIRHQAPAFGLPLSGRLYSQKLTEPYLIFHSIAAGDVNNDGWQDLLITQDGIPRLFLNNGGAGYTHQQGLHQLKLDPYVVHAALVDLNNDGWLDIFISTHKGGNFVLHNSEGAFHSATPKSLPNLDEAYITANSSFGDIDNNGYLDIALGNWSAGRFFPKPYTSLKNALLLNNGKEFSLTPLQGAAGQTLSILFSDWNNDGQQDLIVGNDFQTPDVFYLKNDEGKLNPIGRKDGLIPGSTLGTMSITTADIDNDLIPEVYAAAISRQKPSPVDGQRICSEVNNPTQKASCLDWYKMVEHISHAIDRKDVKACFELNNDQWQDACVSVYFLITQPKSGTNIEDCSLFSSKWSHFSHFCNERSTPVESFSAEDPDLIKEWRRRNVLLKHHADGAFANKAFDLGIGRSGWTWNAKFADLDNDGWKDLFTVNGFTTPRHMPPNESNYFFHNQKGKKFIERSKLFGLDSNLDTFSYVYTDFDNDGDLDIVTLSPIGPVSLYVNNTDNGNSISIKLQDKKGNRSGIGAKIIIHYEENGPNQQMQEIQSGGGYLSFDAAIAHFGLGEATEVSSIEVHWRDGQVSTISSPLTAGYHYVITRPDTPSQLATVTMNETRMNPGL